MNTRKEKPIKEKRKDRRLWLENRTARHIKIDTQVNSDKQMLFESNMYILYSGTFKRVYRQSIRGHETQLFMPFGRFFFLLSLASHFVLFLFINNLRKTSNKQRKRQNWRKLRPLTILGSKCAKHSMNDGIPNYGRLTRAVNFLNSIKGFVVHHRLHYFNGNGMSL